MEERGNTYYQLDLDVSRQRVLSRLLVRDNLVTSWIRWGCTKINFKEHGGLGLTWAWGGRRASGDAGKILLEF